MAKFLKRNNRRLMIGIFGPQLPDHQARHSADEQESKQADEAGGEPVVFLALVEHDLQAAHGDGEETQAEIIHLGQAGTVGLDPRRIIDEAGDQNKRQQPNRNVDEKDPAPGEVVGNPAAQGGPDGGRQHRDQPVESKSLAALVGLERVGHDGLGHGLKAAAPGSLQDAEQQQHGQRKRRTAKKTGDGKDDDTKEEKILASHHAGRPRAQRKDDGVRHQVARQNPGSLVGAGSQAAGDVRQGHVGDGSVEHFHERRKRHGGGDEPRIGARLPHRLHGRNCRSRGARNCTGPSRTCW